MTYTLLTLYKSLNRDLLESALLSGRDRGLLDKDIRKDILVSSERAREEGSSLFTKTYPLLAKHILLCVENGVFSPIIGFKTKTGSKLPCFMHGWLCRLFSSRTGVMLDDFHPSWLQSVRQLLTFAAKAKSLPTESACRKAYTIFKEDDDEIKNQSLWSRNISTFGYSVLASTVFFTVDNHWRNGRDIGRLFLQVGRTIGSVFDSRYPNGILDTEHRPKHGPGAVAECFDNDNKWLDISNGCDQRLSDVFPSYDYINLRENTSTTANCFNSSSSESRLLAVPKTALTPRLIAAEPAQHMYWQQSLLHAFSGVIDKSWLSKSINIADQSVSRARAQLSSCDRSLGTIDLSKASDTVTLDHLGGLFPGDSCLLAQILACRTDSCRLPNGESIRLRKFATMGSAMCFPIESLVFLAAVAASIIRQRDLPVTNRLVREVSQDITVYGDDIIAPTQYIKGILSDLMHLGFLPNKGKTYYKSHFRESCGGDFYQGVSVKPIYLRQDIWLRKRLTDADVISLAAFGRQAYNSGLLHTSRLAFDLITIRSRFTLPYSETETSHLSHNDPDLDYKCKVRFNSNLARREVMAPVIVPLSKESKLDCYARLNRNLANAEYFPTDLLKEVTMDPSKSPTRRIKLVSNYSPV